MDRERTHSPLMKTILTRRSLRQYRPDPVPRDLIDAVLTAAIWAPSAHNRQPWRFAVIESDAYKRKLARAMGAKLRRDLEVDHIAEAMIEADIARSYERITLAPVLILLSLSMADMDSYPDEQRSQNEYMMTVQSVAMAGQNLMLAAHDAGLGTCWMCAPLFSPEIVRVTLKLPDDWQPQGLITLGYPAQTREKTRHPQEERTVWR